MNRRLEGTTQKDVYGTHSHLTKPTEKKKKTNVLKLVLQHFFLLHHETVFPPTPAHGTKKRKRRKGRNMFVSFILELTCAVLSCLSRFMWKKFQCGRNLGLKVCNEFRTTRKYATAESFSIAVRLESDCWVSCDSRYVDVVHVRRLWKARQKFLNRKKSSFDTFAVISPKKRKVSCCAEKVYRWHK